MSDFKFFSTYSEAAEYAKSHSGVRVKRTQNGEGWVVQIGAQNQAHIPKLKPSIPVNQSNHISKLSIPEGWAISRNGNYFKKTDIGIFWVVKSRKGEWYLNAQNSDLSNGYAYATSLMAMQKGDQLLIAKVDRYASFPVPKIPEGRNVPEAPSKILPEPNSPLPEKIVPKKMTNWDGIGGSRKDIKKARGWK